MKAPENHAALRGTRHHPTRTKAMAVIGKPSQGTESVFKNVTERGFWNQGSRNVLTEQAELGSSLEKKSITKWTCYEVGTFWFKLLNFKWTEKLFGFWGRNAIHIQGEENQANYTLSNIQGKKTIEQLSGAIKLSP